MKAQAAQTPHADPKAPRVVDVFLRYLKAEQCKVVFGIPGGLLHPFFEGVTSDAELRLVVPKHEEGAAFMADGYARVGRRLAVCAGTSGPGATNLVTGVACAFADGVPLLVVTGQAASYSLGKGALQETGREDIDIVEMFRPITKYSTMVTSAGSMPHHLRRALRQALAGRPGPVHLNVPVDIWNEPLDEDWFDPQTYRPASHTFDRAAVQRAAEVLVHAKRPVLLAGSGVRTAGAEQQLRAIAEMLPAPVATTPRGKGVLPENHPQSLGVLGFAGHRAAREVIFGDETDVLLTVGASLNETTTLNWSPALRPRTALIQLDIDADRIGRNYPIDVPLVGDAQTILLELIYHLHRLIRSSSAPASEWYADKAPTEPERNYNDMQERHSDAVPLTPQRWRQELDAVLPSNAVVFSDIGGHTLFNIHHLCVRDEQEFVLNMGLGSMGHGTVAPLGAVLAQPQRPVFAIVGDACFTMNGMELLTAAEYELPVIWIVENNQMHGIVWHGSKLVGNHQPMDAVRYRKPLDIAKIADAMGVTSTVVSKPNELGPAIAEALRSGQPALIEVIVDPSIAPPMGGRARTVAGFSKKKRAPGPASGLRLRLDK